MRVGIIELTRNTPCKGWADRLYTSYFRKQYASIMPQAVAVWCRQLGHQVFYATYYGQKDPRSLLPDHLDVVFVASYTYASALAYALAKLFRREKTLTVIGGPHAKSFPGDCLRFFDLVVKDCDRTLIDDILRGHFDPPAIITSGRPLTDFPSVEERMPEIVTSAFYRGKPGLTSFVPLLASVGCPYKCDFCVDWNNQYVALPGERLEADLRYLSENFPRLLVAYHDPNFGVRFDETMDIIETIPEKRRNGYLMESSLSILKESRLERLRRTNCVFVAPGVESWTDYSNKAGVGAKVGRDKLEQVVDHFHRLGQYVAGQQANFVFGTDADRGRDPVELTKEFIRRLPSVWPAVLIPTPLGGTPLYDKCLAEGRILKSMPFTFYLNFYLVITLTNYHPIEYYDHLIDIISVITSKGMLVRRLLTKSHPVVRLIHTLRAFAAREELAEYRRIRKMLATDAQFRAFHEGRSDALPEFYHWRYEQRLGPYAELISRAERIPVLDETVLPTASTPATIVKPVTDPALDTAPALSPEVLRIRRLRAQEG
ncbi:MAG: B12-binding domain-containing radical SAM protein [Nitrospinota bacterium]